MDFSMERLVIRIMGVLGPNTPIAPPPLVWLNARETANQMVLYRPGLNHVKSR